MTSWTRITIDPGSHDRETVSKALQEAISDPETYERYGNLVWKEDADFKHEEIPGLDIPAARVLVIYMNDTANAGRAYLYEESGEDWILTDRITGGVGYSGRDIVDYVRREHGMRGVTRD